MTRNGERDAAGPWYEARKADRRDASSACPDRPSRTDDGEAERRRATAEDTGTEGSAREWKGDGHSIIADFSCGAVRGERGFREAPVDEPSNCVEWHWVLASEQNSNRVAA